MLKRFLRYYIPYKKILTLTLLGAVITSLAELFFPMYLRYIMNDILPRRDVNLLLQSASVLLVLYLLNCL
ncbi:MAG: hypothetical protein ACLT4X_04550 [Phascolarctobacterium sp.]